MEGAALCASETDTLDIEAHDTSTKTAIAGRQQKRNGRCPLGDKGNDQTRLAERQVSDKQM